MKSVFILLRTSSRIKPVVLDSNLEKTFTHSLGLSDDSLLSSTEQESLFCFKLRRKQQLSYLLGPFWLFQSQGDCASAIRATLLFFVELRPAEVTSFKPLRAHFLPLNCFYYFIYLTLSSFFPFSPQPPIVLTLFEFYLN